MRLFVGIALDPEVVERLSTLTAELKMPADDLRWSRPESWHITLQFLGNATAEQYACLKEWLGGIRAPAFRVDVKGLGFFERMGIFYADVPPGAELKALQQRVVAATGSCGFKAEAQAYHPHITLARNKARSQGIRRLKARIGTATVSVSFTPREFLLYESFLGAGGSRYEIRQRFQLSLPDGSESV